MPFAVPSTIDAATARHVGAPKVRRADSEKACPLSFCRRVQRTTSQGGDVVSVSGPSAGKCELRETLREWPPRKAGDGERGLLAPPAPCRLGDAMREEKRRSKGRRDGVGLLRYAREATEGRTLLPGEEIREPCYAALANEAAERKVHVHYVYLYRGRYALRRDE